MCFFYMFNRGEKSDRDNISESKTKKCTHILNLIMLTSAKVGRLGWKAGLEGLALWRRAYEWPKQDCREMSVKDS